MKMTPARTHELLRSLGWVAKSYDFHSTVYERDGRMEVLPHPQRRKAYSGRQWALIHKAFIAENQDHGGPMKQNGRPSKRSTLLKRAYEKIKEELRLTDQASFEAMIQQQQEREAK